VIHTRLFTFGCSFTKYIWPTWADILGEQADDFINLGRAGGGNHQIFFNIMMADKKYTFTSNDTIAICWTYVLREDTWRDGKWHNNSRPIDLHKTKEWLITNNVDPVGSHIKTLSYIKAITHFLNDKKCNNIQFSVDDLSASARAGTFPWEDKFASQLFEEEIKMFDNKNYDKYFDFYKNYSRPRPKNEAYPEGDLHPTPLEHLDFVENVLNIHIDDIIKQKVQIWDQKI